METRGSRLLYILAIACCLAAACNRPAADPHAVHFVSSMSPGEPELVRQIVGRFTQAHAGWQIRYEPISGTYMTLIQTRIAAGSPPDLFTLTDIDAPDLLAASALLPLDEFIARDKLDLGDFYPNLLQAFTYKGKLYGIPKDYNALGLFYNKRLFAQAGLQPPRTWDELKAVAAKLTDRAHGRYGLCLTTDIARWLPFLLQAGGEYLDEQRENLRVNTPEGQQSLRFYIGLVKDGVAVRPDQVGATWAGEAFGRGLVAMAIEGGWMIPSLRQGYPQMDFAVAELPRGKRPANLAFTAAYVIPRAARNPEGAWQLMRYLVSREGMQSWTELGLALPSRKSVPGQTQQGPNAPHWRALAAGMAYARPYQFTYRFAKVLDRANYDLEAAFLGSFGIEQALQDMAEYGNRVLAHTRRRD